MYHRKSRDLVWNYPPPDCQTAIIACRCANGIILGADSRTSKMKSNSVNRATDRIVFMTNKTFCLKSGDSSDTQNMCDFVKNVISLKRNITGECATVAQIAGEFSRYIRGRKSHMSSSVIVAGFDQNTGGDIYKVSSRGNVAQKDLAVIGSCRPYIKASLKKVWWPTMKPESCIEVIKKCICQEMDKDSFSGGVVRVIHLSKNAIKKKFFYNTPSNDDVSDTLSSFSSI